MPAARYLYTVHLLQVTLNLTRGHPPRTHRQDLAVESLEAGWMLPENLRLEAAVAVPRCFDVDLAEVP
jgi:hypothetical protein